jgi:hypothetical protein
VVQEYHPMLGLLFAVLLVIAVLVVAARRRNAPVPADEPWRQSLVQDDEPLDIEEIRRAEAEWAAEEAFDWEEEDESWRG